MNIVTESYLRNAARRRSLNEDIRMFSNSRNSNSFDVFLTHSFADRDIVAGIYNELHDLGLKVYVDWIVDPDLDRRNVTKESAERIRTRMASSKSLIYAFSVHSGFSKWMPWELGFVDANTHKCAILPIAQVSGFSFNRTEYLKLYPIITEEISTYNNKAKLALQESETSVYCRSIKDWIEGRV